MDWYNEPPQWAARDGTVTMHSASKTDFWRLTGIARDSGHFYYQRQAGLLFPRRCNGCGPHVRLARRARILCHIRERDYPEFVSDWQNSSGGC